MLLGSGFPVCSLALGSTLWDPGSALKNIFPFQFSSLDLWNIFSASFLIIESWELRGLFAIWVKSFSFNPGWCHFYIYNLLQIVVGLLRAWIVHSPLVKNLYPGFFFKTSLLLTVTLGLGFYETMCVRISGAILSVERIYFTAYSFFQISYEWVVELYSWMDLVP